MHPIDHEEIENLLGRKPQGCYEVVVRNSSGEARVIRNDPFLDDGTPMPTLYWLVDPEERRLVSRLESRGAIREVESQMMSGQGPPGSVVVVESQIAQQSDHPALSASAFPSANVITSGSDSVTPVVGRSSAELLDALAIAASQGTLGQHSSAGSELEPIDVGVGPSIALSGIPTSVTAKKKKKKTKKKKKKTKKKKGGGTRRRRRGGRTRRRGGRASRSRLRGGGPQLGCGCA